MSGTWPTSPGFSAVGFNPRDYNLSDTTRAGQDNVRGLGSHRFEWSVAYHPLEREEFAPIAAFMALQGGSREKFQITLPEISTLLGDASGLMQVNNIGGHPVGTSLVQIDGITGTVKAGSLVKFAHDKVYMVALDRAGSGALGIYPPLIEAVADNEVVTYDDVPFTARLDTDAPAWEIDFKDEFGFEIAMHEAI